MFNTNLFFKICREYDVEITDNSINPGLFVEMDNGKIVALTTELLNSIIGEPISNEQINKNKHIPYF